MKHGVSRRIVALALTLLVIVVWSVGFFGGEGESLPVYKGKTVEEWFYGASGHPGTAGTFEAATPAFSSLGDSALPFLLERVRTRESALNRFYCWFHPNLPTWLQARMKPPLRATYVQMIALGHLSIIVHKQGDVPRDLVLSIPEIDDDQNRFAAFYLFARHAGKSGNVEEQRSLLLSSLGDRDFRIQLEAAIALARIEHPVTNGVPILLNAITNSSLMKTHFPGTANSGGLALGKTPPISIAALKRQEAHSALHSIAPLLATKHQVPAWRDVIANNVAQTTDMESQ